MNSVKYAQILDVVKRIDWKGVESLNGKGKVDVIERFFTSSKRSWWHYEQDFYHNGFIYEGVFFVLPILINSLKLTNAKDIDKEMVLSDIQTILWWRGDNSKFCSFDYFKKPFIHYVPSERANAIKLPLSFACRFAIMNEINFFVEDCKINMTGHREESVDLLMQFEECLHLVINSLSDIYAKRKMKNLKST